jgi:hypothetical protein
MERKDVEQKLQESAEEIQIPEFEELWESLQPRIEREKERKKKRNFVLYKLFAPIACCAVAICVALPFILPKESGEPTPPTLPPPVYYLNDDLTIVNTDEANFLSSIQSSSVPVVDFSRFKNEVCAIYTIDTGDVKGGKSNFLDSQEIPTCMIQVKFYAEDVKVSDMHYDNFDLGYTTQSGAVIEYKYDADLSKYYIKAEYKTVQYFMEYTGVNETVTQFFEMFFQ